MAMKHVDGDDNVKLSLYTLSTCIWCKMTKKLLTEGSPAFPRLKTLEGKGVQILAGRLCLHNLCISETIVGKPASMDEILDFILNNEVINL